MRSRSSRAGWLATAVTAVALAACATTPAASQPLATSGPLALPTVSRSFPADRVIEIELGEMSIERDGQRLRSLELAAGDEYLFRVRNDSGAAHDFYVGAPADLAENRVDRLTGVPIFDGGVSEFAYRVPRTDGPLGFACTIMGHLPHMNGEVVVTD